MRNDGAERRRVSEMYQSILRVLLIFAVSAGLQLQPHSLSFCNFQGSLRTSRLSTSRSVQELRLFSELHISEESKKAFADDFGFDKMTEVQAAAIEPMLEGKDVIVRAKTGTGKTLGFLLPVVEAIRMDRAEKGSISALIISPTRELAGQIAKEASVLLKHHPLSVACIYGGVGKISKDLKSLAGCDILVATPGRLQDHLDNTQDFKKRLLSLRFLVLDEADQLLDMGFKSALRKIFQSLPPVNQRRTALFSATFPAELDEMGKLALKPNHLYINTVKADEEVTPNQIDQSFISSDMKGMMTLLWKALAQDRATSSASKVIVFFNTANSAGFWSQQFSAAGLDVLEVHSRKTQSHRTKCSEKFRKSKSAIMFTSDVSARGVDYPDVTAVIQVGAASSTEQYIHRIGRTGRAGKSGHCLLLLHDFESYFLRQLDAKGLQVKKLREDALQDVLPPSQLKKPVSFESAARSYKAWLGYFNSNLKSLGWKKDKLVDMATKYAESIGACQNGVPPPLEKKTVGKMGLKGVPGLNIAR